MKFTLLLIAAAGVVAVSSVPSTAQRSNPFGDFHKQAELAIGKPAPLMHLQDSEGVERDLRDYLGRYVFIEFGSYT